jgi:IS30 family transposase
MPAMPLRLFEREEIRAGIERGDSISAVAARLGRHRCTISAEVSRNGGPGAYRATAAQTRADAERARPKTPILVARPELAAHVEGRLRAKDSPMTIAVELAQGVHPGIDATVSHETIYAALYAHGRRGLAKGLHAGLHRRRRCRKRRTAKGEQPQGKSPLGNFNPIASRPAAASGRDEVGHLEGDLIIGAAGRSAIATVFDRTSRHMWLADLPEDHGAESTLAGLVELIERIPARLRRTLTWDQGREMARWADLTKLCGIDVYFAEPHHPWQRPTNENGNGLLRRYVGKGTDLSIYTPTDLRAIETRINTMPRRSLHWSTAHHVYTAAVAMTG